MKPIRIALMAAANSGPAYLDLLVVTPVCALSLKKLISTATNAIRVRRSSDNAEQDIGFTGDALDTASLASFVGANSAYVKTFYDQTGGGFNATQVTAADQPRIVNAGSYDAKAIFDATNDFLKITSLTLGTPQLGIYTKCDTTSTSAADKIWVESSPDESITGGFYLDSYAGSMYCISNNAAGANLRQNAFAYTTGFRQRTVLMDRTIVGVNEIAMWDAGSALTPSQVNTTEQTGNFATTDVYIGSRGGTTYFSEFGVESLVFYNADSAAIRTAIEGLVG